MWKNNVKKEDQIYYDNILYIIDENFDIKFPNYIKIKIDLSKELIQIILLM